MQSQGCLVDQHACMTAVYLLTFSTQSVAASVHDITTPGTAYDARDSWVWPSPILTHDAEMQRTTVTWHLMYVCQTKEGTEGEGAAGYAFFLSPNQTPYRDMYFLEKLTGLGENDGVQVNAVFTAICLMMGVWPCIYSALLIPSARSGNKASQQSRQELEEAHQTL